MTCLSAVVPSSLDSVGMVFPMLSPPPWVPPHRSHRERTALYEAALRGGEPNPHAGKEPRSGRGTRAGRPTHVKGAGASASDAELGHHGETSRAEAAVARAEVRAMLRQLEDRLAPQGGLPVALTLVHGNLYQAGPEQVELEVRDDKLVVKKRHTPKGSTGQRRGESTDLLEYCHAAKRRLGRHAAC